jgi:hypothetical protein
MTAARHSWWRLGGLFGLLAPVLVAPEVRAGLCFRQTTVELGEVRRGVPLTQEFTFVNEGPEIVEVLDVRPGCGCLRPRLSGRTFAAGQGGGLTLEVNTLGQPAGTHTWRVQLHYRKGDVEEEAALAVSARVVAEVAVEPAALTLFTEGALTQDVTLTDLRKQPLTLVDVRTSSGRLHASPAAAATDASGHRVYRIKLEASADCPEGRHEEVLSIYTSDPLYGLLQVPVTVVRQARQRLTVRPAQVQLRAAPGQPLASQLLQVGDASGEPVVIEAVTADDPAVQCRWASGPGNLATVRVQVDRARFAGRLKSAIHIRAAGREPVTVPVLCSVE